MSNTEPYEVESVKYDGIESTTSFKVRILFNETRTEHINRLPESSYELETKRGGVHERKRNTSPKRRKFMHRKIAE